jgi:hypothetical protein
MDLFNIGGVRCALTPFNVDSANRDGAADFAKHPIIGARESYEFMGVGVEKLSLSGKLFPRLLGGEAELELLHSLREAGDPVMVTRGNEKLGWFHIMSLSDRHSYLSARGVGNKIEFRIELEKCDKPSSATGASLLVRLFGYV